MSATGETLSEQLAEGYDAHETLKRAEPPFTLQGGDPLAPPTVIHWAELARAEARRILNGGRAGFEPEHPGEEYVPTPQDMLDADALLRKATSAEMVAADMIAYQRGHGEVAEARATYADLDLQEGADVLQVRKSLIRAASNLQNARGIAKEVEERLAGLGIHLEEQVAILQAVETMGEVATAIDPRKGGERS